MNIHLNGKLFAITEGSSLQDLLAQLGLLEKRVAVELNEEIIPRSLHAQSVLQTADKVEIIHAIGGG